MGIFLNQLIQFYSNNATNLRHLTTHSTTVLTYKMAIVLRPQIRDVISPTYYNHSMWAQRERQNFRSSLKPISVTPAPRSALAAANFFTPAHRSAHQIFGLLRSRSAPMFQAANRKWTEFSFNVTYRPIVYLYSLTMGQFHNFTNKLSQQLAAYIILFGEVWRRIEYVTTHPKCD